jgi:hypothetical protein
VQALGPEHVQPFLEALGLLALVLAPAWLAASPSKKAMMTSRRGGSFCKASARWSRAAQFAAPRAPGERAGTSERLSIPAASRIASSLGFLSFSSLGNFGFVPRITPITFRPVPTSHRLAALRVTSRGRVFSSSFSASAAVT